MKRSFHDHFVELFNTHFGRLYRYLDRLTGDPDLAADLAQEAFVRLYRRGTAPDAPEAWLITVATNLFRNARSTEARRLRLVAAAPPPPAATVEVEDSDPRVRQAIDQLPERDRSLLLLRAEGYSYRELADGLNLNLASVGTLLARAKRAFRDAYGEAADAS